MVRGPGSDPAPENESPGGGEEAPDPAEGLGDGARLVAAVDEAVRAPGIAARVPVVIPRGVLEELGERPGVALPEEVAGALPAEDPVRGVAPGSALQVAMAEEVLQVERGLVEAPVARGVREEGAEEGPGTGPRQEVLLVGGRGVGVARRQGHALDPELHHPVEEGAHPGDVRPLEEGRVRRDPEAASDRLLDRPLGDRMDPVAIDGPVMGLPVPVEVDREREVPGRAEPVQVLLQEDRVGAEIDVLPAGDDALDDRVDLRVEERLPAGDRDHRRTALVDRGEALVDGELATEDVGGVLDLSASGAREVAPVEGLEHEDERVARAAPEALAQDVGRHRPDLREGNGHGMPQVGSVGRMPARRAQVARARVGNTSR